MSPRISCPIFNPSRIRLVSATLLAMATMEAHAANVISNTQVALTVSSAEESSGIIIDANWMSAASVTATGGIAITSVDSSTGTWTYSTDQTNWTPIPAVSTTNAMILPLGSYLRFVRSVSQGYATASNDSAKPFITFLSYDPSNVPPTAGSLLNTTIYSGNIFSSYTGNIVLNNAPTANYANVTINHGLVIGGTASDAASTGLAIDQFISDADIGAYYGLAITSNFTNGSPTTGSGQWEVYVPPNGWQAFNGATTQSPNYVRLIGSTTGQQPPRIRFNCTSDYVSPFTPSFNFYAWDQTNGATEGSTDFIVPGYSPFGAFSQYSATIQAVFNHAPTLTATVPAIGPTIIYPVAQNLLVSFLRGFDFSDQDAQVLIPRLSAVQITARASASNSNLGIAITAADSSHGTWSFSPNDGVTWIPFGNVSTNNALFLDPSDRIQFTPTDPLFDGTIAPALTYSGWDGTDIISRNGDVAGQEVWRWRAEPAYSPLGALSPTSQTTALTYAAADATVTLTLLPQTLAIINQPFSALVAATTSRTGAGVHAVIFSNDISSSWLTLTDQGNGTAILSGTPTSTNSAIFTLNAKDSVRATNTSAGQPITITVLPATSTALSAPTIPRTDATGTPKFTTIAGSTPEGVASIKAAFAGLSHTQARAFAWDASIQDYVELPAEPAGGLTPQHALFIVSRVDLSIALSGQPAANPGELALKPGWNFLTVPPLTDGTNVVSTHAWSRARAISAEGLPSLPDPAFKPWSYDGSTYAQTDNLMTGVGYWFHNTAPAIVRLRFDEFNTPSPIVLAAPRSEVPAESATEPPPPPNLSAPAQTSSASTGGGCGLGSGVAGIGLMLFAALRALFTGTRNRR